MDEAKIDQIRQQLLSLRSELQAMELATRKTSEPVELDQARVGRLTRMDAMQAQQMALETARRRQQQLVQVEGALHRIDSGEFGDCFICGEAIDSRRLSIDPTITRCMGCVDK